MRKAIPSVLFAILIPATTSAQETEIEPNGDVASSTNWTYGQVSGGHCGSAWLDQDHFRIVRAN